MPNINSRVLDLGLNVLVTEADRLYVCSREPTTYAEATSTYALGSQTFTRGQVFGAPADSSGGRKVASNAIASGTVSANGTAIAWAIVDSTTSRLLATGAIASTAVTTPGNFSLSSFDVSFTQPGTTTTGGGGGGTVGGTAASTIAIRGVNLAVGSFTPGTVPGTLDQTYSYGTNAEIDYYTSRGLKYFRQDFFYARLNRAPDYARVAALIDYAATKGATFILDDHEYGKTATGKVIGVDAGSNTEFANQWVTIWNNLKGSPVRQNIIIGLMNEPVTQTGAQWMTGANAAIAALRQAGFTGIITIPGSYWDGAWAWLQNDNQTALLPSNIQDPLNNYLIEMHQYLDTDGSGDPAHACVAGAGSTRLVAATGWARTNKVRLFLGEFGFRSDDTTYMQEGTALLDYMRNNEDVWAGWTYWAGGPWWGGPAGYAYCCENIGGADPANLTQLIYHEN